MLNRIREHWQERLRHFHRLALDVVPLTFLHQAPRMFVSFGDESFVSTTEGDFYVIAMVRVREARLHQARDFALRSCLKPGLRFHFHSEGPQRRTSLVESLRSGPWEIQTLATGAGAAQQERVRRLLLKAHFARTTDHRWILESRGARADLRDIELIEALSQAPRHHFPHVSHSRSETEPLLWVADVFAGACSSALAGRADYEVPFCLL